MSQRTLEEMIGEKVLESLSKKEDQMFLIVETLLEPVIREDSEKAFSKIIDILLEKKTTKLEKVLFLAEIYIKIGSILSSRVMYNNSLTQSRQIIVINKIFSIWDAQWSSDEVKKFCFKVLCFIFDGFVPQEDYCVTPLPESLKALYKVLEPPAKIKEVVKDLIRQKSFSTTDLLPWLDLPMPFNVREILINKLLIGLSYDHKETLVGLLPTILILNEDGDEKNLYESIQKTLPEDIVRKYKKKLTLHFKIVKILKEENAADNINYYHIDWQDTRNVSIQIRLVYVNPYDKTTPRDSKVIGRLTHLKNQYAKEFSIDINVT